jgi:hypothetical protein
LLFIVGAGFDPRVLDPLKAIVAADASANSRCMAIDMAEGFDTDEPAGALGRQNRQGLQNLFPGKRLVFRALMPTDTDGIRNVSRSTALLFADMSDWLNDYTDVVVDISALPRLVYLTLLTMLLQRVVTPQSDPSLGGSINLHVVYAEAAAIDSAISKYEIGTDLAPIQNLIIRLDEEASLNWPLVWFPILAEDVGEQLTRIGDRTMPNEICPVLPVQSANPRRGDNIIQSLGELLFDRFDIDNRDIIRATESNPFQLYRSLMKTMARYEESLRLFGGVRFVISPLSSKGLSIGCLLAAYEKRITGDPSSVRVGMAHVESKSYGASSLPIAPYIELISAWLAGECYQGGEVKQDGR